MRRALERRWYSDEPAPLVLQALATLFGAAAARRRKRLQHAATPLEVPVVVVGNLSVGGTGKTPFTIWLVGRLREWGFKPGVVSRGYGGRAPHHPFLVRPGAKPAEAGDEPLLIAQHTGVPVMVDADRVAAARALIERHEIDVIVSDDGLQHYRLARDLEICVIDGARGFGNGALLPAGPLREPVSRLAEIPLVVVNGGALDLSHPGLLDMSLRAGLAQPLVAGGEPLRLDRLSGQRVHAVAGIGNPTRFFAMLRERGIEVIEHPFPDHHHYAATDLHFDDSLPVLMTDKDAIKCRAFALSRHYTVPVEALIDPAGEALVQQFCLRLKRPRIITL